MFKQSIFCALAGAFIIACNDNKRAQEEITSDSTTASKPPTEQPSNLPDFVVYRNWETGNPENSNVVLNTYKAWDSDSIGVMSSYFADTTRFDLPDGRRFTTNNMSIEPTLRKWRKNYKETSNIPFSLISLHNKDVDQQWVIAWTWNKWRRTDGTKDSMLYCDNFRLKDGRIVYLNSLENRPSKPLIKTLNTINADK